MHDASDGALARAGTDATPVASSQKLPYEAPAVTVLGSLIEITRGGDDVLGSDAQGGGILPMGIS
ncbi:MAG TPA: lasso RiPP family leader peptide-containing protein [Actinomycetota bacterium]|nr:lasso RiPP family leader peptide-containing protein [Actinomycetota bacterium]